MEILEVKHLLATQLDELVQLRPMPVVAMQIMKACREKQVSVKTLVQIAECDPAISSRILATVNSSVYGYSRQVTSIGQAVVVLGFKNLSELAVSVAMSNVFSEDDSLGQDRQKLFEHSLGCASVSRVLASKSSFASDPGEAFLAGMMHDIGKLIFFDLAPVQYRTIEDNREQQSPLQIEQQTFGVDHTVLGAKFGEFWGLPAGIQQAIADHHIAIPASQPQPPNEVTVITNIANDLAKSWGIGQPNDAPEALLGQASEAWLLDQSSDSIEQIQSVAMEHFAELNSLLRPTATS
ncbi:MAG: HDOD domain-containing protein [Mariniblastus sp.]